jgi:hypothetical protein
VEGVAQDEYEQYKKKVKAQNYPKEGVAQDEGQAKQKHVQDETKLYDQKL